MDALEAIMSRRSVRMYTERPVSGEDLHKILAAGMSGPTAVNARDWAFIVVRDKEMLAKMADVNGRAAEPLRNAAVGVLICGDLSRAYEGAKEYWVVDGAIAGQNMVLAAQAMGIGSVWLGTWPQPEKVEGQAALFQLPSHIVPHSIVAFGWPAQPYPEKKMDYEESQVHFEKWQHRPL